MALQEKEEVKDVKVTGEVIRKKKKITGPYQI